MEQTAAPGNYDYLFKILLIGDSGVGKSSLMLRFADDEYKGDSIATVGVDFKIRTLVLDGKTAKLQIWDTAGAERFRTITTSYFRGADGVIVVYDVSSGETFEHVADWLGTQRQHCREGTLSMLLGAKCDVPQDKRQVPTDAGVTKAEAEGMLFMETSAKDNINVEQAFRTFSEALRKKRDARRVPAPVEPPKVSSPALVTELPPAGHILLHPGDTGESSSSPPPKKGCAC
eukprot:m51a1_g10465 putative ras-related protein rabd2a-like (231) ;mRNA; r:44143-45312